MKLLDRSRCLERLRWKEWQAFAAFFAASSLRCLRPCWANRQSEGPADVLWWRPGAFEANHEGCLIDGLWNDDSGSDDDHVVCVVDCQAVADAPIWPEDDLQIAFRSRIRQGSALSAAASRRRLTRRLRLSSEQG